MKTLLTIFTLIFTVMFSTTSFAEWTKVGGNQMGTLYVNFERIRKVDGYVYFWVLSDFLKPNPKTGTISMKIYHQGDCKLFRHKRLSFSFHKEPMGRGTCKTNNDPDKNWVYPHPESSGEKLLESVCSR